MTDTCFVCKTKSHVSFRRYFSTKNDSYYFYSAEKNTSVWAQNSFQFNYLCTNCVETICEASWIQQESKSNPNQTYYYNYATCQSRNNVPQLIHKSNLLTAAVLTPTASVNVELGNKFYSTPEKLQGKRDYFFKGMKNLLKSNPTSSTGKSSSIKQQEKLSFDSFQIDHVASFSVTKSEIATQISEMILTSCGNNKALSICDGMACVGGNTLSFAQYFSKVVSNEYDYERWDLGAVLCCFV